MTAPFYLYPQSPDEVRALQARVAIRWALAYVKARKYFRENTPNQTEQKPEDMLNSFMNSTLEQWEALTNISPAETEYKVRQWEGLLRDKGLIPSGNG